MDQHSNMVQPTARRILQRETRAFWLSYATLVALRASSSPFQGGWWTTAIGDAIHVADRETQLLDRQHGRGSGGCGEPTPNLIDLCDAAGSVEHERRRLSPHRPTSTSRGRQRVWYAVGWQALLERCSGSQSLSSSAPNKTPALSTETFSAASAANAGLNQRRYQPSAPNHPRGSLIMVAAVRRRR